MASEAAFIDQLKAFDPAAPAAPTNSRSKRKRNVADNPAPARTAPMSRRGNAAQLATQQQRLEEQQQAPGSEQLLAQPEKAGAEGLAADGVPAFGTENLEPALGPTGEGEESSNVDTAAAALSYTVQVPEFPAAGGAVAAGGSGAAAAAAVGGGDNDADGKGAGDADEGDSFENLAPGAAAGNAAESETEPQSGAEAAAVNDFPESPTPAAEKPVVGSEEWTRMRKDNHKEVERRRREAINEGINNLTKIVPGCEKNKGAVLACAVQYIHQLRDEASQNIDKWAFEKLVTEQALHDLSNKLHRAWAEKMAWMKVAREAGVDVDTVELELDIEGSRDAEEAASQQRREETDRAKDKGKGKGKDKELKDRDSAAAADGADGAEDAAATAAAADGPVVASSEE